jgi:hypothetical protein
MGSCLKIRRHQGNSPGRSASRDRCTPFFAARFSRMAETLYGGYWVNNRDPTPGEIECSDPQAPCLLPASSPLKTQTRSDSAFAVDFLSQFVDIRCTDGEFESSDPAALIECCDGELPRA